jgi:hypothetical protein
MKCATCRTHEEYKNELTISSRKPEGKRSIDEYGKIILKLISTNWIQLAQGQIESCDHCIETSGNLLSGYRLPRKEE